MKRLTNTMLLALVAALPVSQEAMAQGYPSKPVHMIISFPPGGSTDVIARTVSQKLQEQMGQPVVVENRPGGGTIISAQAVKSAPADGHTLFMALDFTMTMNPSLYAKLPYDPMRDFVAVSRVAESSLAMFINPKRVKAANVQELISLGRANPGKLNFGFVALSSQLAGVILKNETGLQMVEVPFNATPPMLQALLNGELDVVISDIPPYLPFIKEGRLVALMSSGDRREVQLPQTPTAREAGVPYLSSRNWFGVFAPAGTPQSVVAKLNAELGRALAAPEVKERLASIGVDPSTSTPAELASLVERDIAKMGKIIRDAGIKRE